MYTAKEQQSVIPPSFEKHAALVNKDNIPPESVTDTLPVQVKQDPLVGNPPPVVVTGESFDENKHYLFVTMGNHTVQPLNENLIGFDATSNRLMTFVSVHDTCGAIVCSSKHIDAMQNLGYPVVLYGQTIAFPLETKDIKKMGSGAAYPGGLVMQTFCEPETMHNMAEVKNLTIVGDGNFGGLNHVAGTYVPLAFAIQAATGGDTCMTVKTNNSSTGGEHLATVIVGLNKNTTSVRFKNGSGGEIAADNVVTKCLNCKDDTMPLVIGNNQINSNFETMIKEVSGSPSSYVTSLVDTVVKTVGTSMFAEHAKKLESDIRKFSCKNVNETGLNAATTPLKVNMVDLPAHLQVEYCCDAMLGMKQPFSIASPTIIAKTLPPDINGNVADTSAAEAKQAALYGTDFHTCSYALGEHFTCDAGENGDISNSFGPVAVMHALLLSQTSLVEVEKACLPFAKADSAFLPCQDKLCECNSVPVNVPSVPSKAGKSVVSSKFEKMLLGVSQNIALSSNMEKSNNLKRNTGDSVSISPVGLFKPEHITPPVKSTQESTQCTAATDFKGNCRCKECVDTCRFLHICQLVASATHSYQKLDNYTSDQTVCGLSAQTKVPQYMSTESMLPFLTIAKAIRMKSSPDHPNLVSLQVGMCQDDCENFGMQMKSIMKTLPVAAATVAGHCFHKVVGGVKSTVALIARDAEHIRQLQMGDLSTQDQRRILLFCETSQVSSYDLSFIVTGSPSKAADKHASTKSNMNTSTNTNTHTDTHAVSVADGCTPYTAASDNIIELHTEEGIGLKTIKNKKPSHPRKISSRPDDLHSRTSADTASEESGGMGGHCTVMISIITKNGLRHSTLVEGTAPVKLLRGDQKIDVEHRGSLGHLGAQVSGDVGIYGSNLKTESCVDIKQSCTIASHVATISSRMQVEGSTFRPGTILAWGNDIDNNFDFYRAVVSVAGCQMVQSMGPGEIRPGADVKMMMNQKVSPVISFEDAVKGPASIQQKMGCAQCAYVQICNPNHQNVKDYAKVGNDFRKAMSPLRFKKEEQQTLILNSYGGLKSLTVEFPDSFELDKKHGKNTLTMCFTHVATDDTIEGRIAVQNSVASICNQFNNDYVNVRFSVPMLMESGEILTHYRIYGVPADPLVP